MVDDANKTKNLMDLQYNRILSEQNIYLVFIGTLIVSSFFTNISKLYPGLTLTNRDVLIFLFFVGAFAINYFSAKLNNLEEEIKNI